jgi:hypothetical protein
VKNGAKMQQTHRIESVGLVCEMEDRQECNRQVIEQEKILAIGEVEDKTNRMDIERIR